MERKCAICERSILRGTYCYKCYKEYEKDILAREEWTKVLSNIEHKRRRKPQFKLIYLGDNLDIDDDYNLVYKDDD